MIKAEAFAYRFVRRKQGPGTQSTLRGRCQSLTVVKKMDPEPQGMQTRMVDTVIWSLLSGAESEVAQNEAVLGAEILSLDKSRRLCW